MEKMISLNKKIIVIIGIITMAILFIFLLYFPIIYTDIAINRGENQNTNSENITYVATNTNPFQPKISAIIKGLDYLRTQFLLFFYLFNKLEILF